MNKRVEQIVTSLQGLGTNPNQLYTNQEVVDHLKELQSAMARGAFEKTHAEHLRDKDIMLHFKTLAEEYGLAQSDTYCRFEANMTRYVQPFGDIYMHALQMLIVPLVFSSLISGMAGMTDTKTFGRVGIKGLLSFMGTTVIAAVFSLLFANATHIGAGANLVLDGAQSVEVTVGEKAKSVLNFFDGFQTVMFKISSMVMVFTPYAVFAMMASTISKNGPKIFLPLLSFILLCYACFVAYTIITYSILLVTLGKMNPLA